MNNYKEPYQVSSDTELKTAKVLAKELEKLESYITQYTSRSMNVEEALGKPGTAMLMKIFQLKDDLL